MGSWRFVTHSYLMGDDGREKEIEIDVEKEAGKEGDGKEEREGGEKGEDVGGRRKSGGEKKRKKRIGKVEGFF